MRADLHQRAADLDAGAEDLARDGAGGDPRGGLARRGAAAAAIVAHPVFLPIGIVGVAGAKPVGDVAVILRALVGVFDQQLDRGPGGDPVEHAAHDAHEVLLAPLGGKARLAGLALVEPALDVGLGERQARRRAVDDDPDCRPVAFAPGGEAEQGSKGVAGHRLRSHSLNHRHSGDAPWGMPGTHEHGPVTAGLEPVFIGSGARELASAPRNDADPVSSRFSHTTEMSGASTAFMPTTW